MTIDRNGIQLKNRHRKPPLANHKRNDFVQKCEELGVVPGIQIQIQQTNGAADYSTFIAH